MSVASLELLLLAPESEGVAVGLVGASVVGVTLGDGDCEGLDDVVGDAEVDVGVADGVADEVVGDGDDDGVALGVADALGVGQADEDVPGNCGREVGIPVDSGFPDA